MFRLTAAIWTTSTWHGRGTTKSSSTCSLDYQEQRRALRRPSRLTCASRQPPLLAIWGKNDPFFIPAGAEAFKRDVPDAEVRFVDTGHFALETHAREIGAAMRDFLAKHLG